MNPIADALLAVMANKAGDRIAARNHLASAQRDAQTAARRHRQVVEIASVVVDGKLERAEGLALIHNAEFPDDRELLARITGTDTDGSRP